MITLLDNPVWSALCSKQNQWNVGTDAVKYFPANMSPFIAINNWHNANNIEELYTTISENRTFALLTNTTVNLPPNLFQIVFTTPLYQMYCKQLSFLDSSPVSIQQLTNASISQMLALTELTKPGPFYEKTIDFGNYIGIFNEDELIAMAGERLQLHGYTEVSAICTKPGYLGKGFASYLLFESAKRIINEGNIPFLHVKTDNTRAIAVYQKLGFEIRTEMFFAIFKKIE